VGQMKCRLNTHTACGMEVARRLLEHSCVHIIKVISVIESGSCSISITSCNISN
jgi:hypothetical protein